MAPMEYLGAWGTLIHEKNLKSKISCQTPFNDGIEEGKGVGEEPNNREKAWSSLNHSILSDLQYIALRFGN
jgi:hypothetical protein